MTSAQLAFSINSKLLGQVNLAGFAAKYLAMGVPSLVTVLSANSRCGGAIAALVNRR